MNVVKFADHPFSCNSRRALTHQWVEADALCEIARISGRRSVVAGGTIMVNGGEASLVGTVLAGILKISKTLLNGREQIVRLVYPGEFFGQLFEPRMDVAIEAATDADLCVADRVAYEGVVIRYPKLQQAVLHESLHELAVARENMLLLSCQTTLERVATYLLVMLERREQILSDMAVRPQRDIAVSQIRRVDLASYLSTTFETISRHLHQLSDMDVIRIIDNNHFEIVDKDRLLCISGVTDADLRVFRPSNRQPDASWSAMPGNFGRLRPNDSETLEGL